MKRRFIHTTLLAPARQSAHRSRSNCAAALAPRGILPRAAMPAEAVLEDTNAALGGERKRRAGISAFWSRATEVLPPTAPLDLPSAFTTKSRSSALVEENRAHPRDGTAVSPSGGGRHAARVARLDPGTREQLHYLIVRLS